MGTEGVWLDDAAPVGIERDRSRRTDAFPPMVFVGKASPWPTDVRDLQSLKGRDHVVANSSRVWNAGVWADPDPFVDAMAEVLGKLAEEVAVNLCARLGSIDQ